MALDNAVFVATLVRVSSVYRGMASSTGLSLIRLILRDGMASFFAPVMQSLMMSARYYVFRDHMCSERRYCGVLDGT